MKIQLFTLNASHAHSALAVRCLADALRAAGFDAAVLEATLKDRTHTVLADLLAAKADIYAFSCYIWNIDAMLSLAQDLRALHPSCRILLGGPEVSFATERFCTLPFVDCVITGEGESALIQAATLLAKGELLPPVLCGAPFAGFLTAGIHYTPDEALGNLLYYESARGCPFSCAFCLSGVNDAAHRVRAKSAELTLAELAAFEEFPRPLTVKLVDRTFNFDKARAKRIWQGLLSPRYTKCYHFEIAAHLLDEESFAILAQFPKGKVRLEIGLQSTNPDALDAVSRHTDAAAVLAAAKRLTQAGNLHVHLDLIAGLPYEDYTSFARSFDAAYPCCDVLQLGFLKLLHGTPLRQKATEYQTIFTAQAPYTVLKTAWLSFTELERLHAISDLCERIRDSGRFAQTLALLIPAYLSPFAFFEGLLAHINHTTGKEVQRISQRDLFVLLSDFAKAHTPTNAHKPLREALLADFARSEVRKPPHTL